MQGKGIYYRRWAATYNLKQISETFLFMREQHIESFEALYRRTGEAVARFNSLNETRFFAGALVSADILNYDDHEH